VGTYERAEGRMSEWTLPVVAVLLLAYGAVSARAQRSPVSQAMVFVSMGLLLGSRALDFVDVGAASSFLRHLAEATLTLMLFTDAVRINRGALRREAQVPIRLLGIGLPLTIAAGTAGAWLLFPSLGLWTAAALATILAPTDAALGQPVVSNQRLPSRIRQGLNLESGLNDGICVPLLIIFLTLAEAQEGDGGIEPLRVVTEEIGFGLVAGVVAGGLAGLVLRQARRQEWMAMPWQQINGVATPLLAYTLAVALGGSGFIAAFVAGIIFALVAGAAAEHTTAFAEQSGEMLNAVTFLMFGAVLLGPALTDLDWRVATYAVLSLTVVRMLPVAIATLGMRMRHVTVGFLGWFGPRGLASIVFVLLLAEESGLPEAPLMLTVVTITVALSVVAHGITAWPGANRYADWYDAHSHDHDSMPESTPVAVPRGRPSVLEPAHHPLREPTTTS
jgi:sodium/hydrogen antiporter